MKEIMSRTGEKIGIMLFGKDGSARELESMEEYDFLVNLQANIRRSLKYIIKKSVQRGDFASFFALFKFLVKKAAGAEIHAERQQLFEKLTGISHFELLFRGKRIRFSENPYFIFNTIHQVFVENQYDVDEMNMKGKTVVDAGSQIGDFSIFCACFGAKKIYAFEPLGKNFRVLRDNIRLNGMESTIMPIKKGLGSRNFYEEVPAEVDVTEASINPRGSLGRCRKTEKIEIVTLDSFLAGERVSFLKMDVEGNEEDVLIGAKETIRNFKPVLSFSAYHKPTDKTRLPEVVRSIRPDYKIKLNSFYEEDFYCE
jgi:FkbM family methyltransferase